MQGVGPVELATLRTSEDNVLSQYLLAENSRVKTESYAHVIRMMVFCTGTVQNNSDNAKTLITYHLSLIICQMSGNYE